jgi:transposase-like protein
MGRIVKSQVNDLIGNHITSDNIFCTDSWRAYKTYAKEKNIEHYRFKSDGKIRVIKGLYHIENVNNYHSRLKKWMFRFNGVASKYLDNYLSWFRFLDSNGFEDSDKNIRNMMINSCLFRENETYNSLRLSKFKI